MENSFSHSSLYGIYELDERGTVLYSSLKAADGSVQRACNLDGLDFFKGVARFKNAKALHLRFDRFLQAGIPTETFDFICSYDNDEQIIRVLLARLVKDQSPRSYLVYIRNHIS